MGGGGKSKSSTIGYWYKVLYHAGLCKGPFDAFLEFRGGTKPAWVGELTQSGTITVNAPNLWGGEKDQGGIVGDVDVMFGEASQVPNAYLRANLGDQVPAWRGLGTLVFKGGKYGAMNPYPQKASYKIRKILRGWDNDAPWYPEKAVIDMSYGQLGMQIGESSEGWSYKNAPNGSADDYSAADFDHSAWEVGASPFASKTGHPYAASGGFPDAVGILWPINSTLWVRRVFTLDRVLDLTITIFVDNYATVWVNGVLVLPRAGTTDLPGVAGFMHEFSVPASILKVGANVIALKAEDMGEYSYAAFRLVGNANRVLGMNPAHVLYFCRTNSDMGREPTASINDASLRAAADTLYDEGFGVCTVRDPAAESVEEFERRICKLIGGSFTRDLVDGQWHLDLARGGYDSDTLPILTDDDILEFKELPSTLDNSINSVSVKYFDPNTKEQVVTPPAQARALTMAFGTIHQTNEYLEIPTPDLAARIALRDLLTTATPTRAFDLVTTRKPYSWRPNQYFRLQAPKRGIADMVCIVGEKQSGSLKSGAIRMKAAQDIYTLPATSFVEVEPGVDLTPSQIPVPIAHQRVFEAPYIDVVAALSRADLAVLPPETGFLLGVAADPAQSRDYSMRVAASGGAYSEVAFGPWCPTAVVVEAASYAGTSYTLRDGQRLDEVVVGMAVLWDEEIGRVEAIDAAAGTIRIARGCADTVPQRHAAGSRLWFWQDHAAVDFTEYTAGESINVKLLTNTGSQQLAESLAPAMPLTFRERQASPYPPARLRILGVPDPRGIAPADIQLSWVHRNRVTQADQLIDTEAASISPENGTAYRLAFHGEAGALAKQYDLTGLSQSWTTEVADSQLYRSAEPIQAFETFATALPANYGAVRVQIEGGQTAEYVPAVGALALTNALPKQSYYALASLGLMTEVDIEADIEMIEAYDALRHAGFFLESNRGSPSGIRVAHYAPGPRTWYPTLFREAWYSVDIAASPLAAPTWAVGDRRRLRLLWSARNGEFHFLVDGVSVLRFVDRTFPALTPGIFFYNCKLCVHQVLVRGTSASLRRNNQVRVTLDTTLGPLASFQKHDRTLIRAGYGYSYGAQYGGL